MIRPPFAVLIFGLGRALAPATPIPIEDLARAPLISDVTLSPDGKTVAFIRNDDADRGSLLLLDLATGKLDGIAATSSFDVYSNHWSRDGRLLYQLSRQKRYAHGLYIVEPGQLARQRTINLVDVVRVVGRPVARPRRLLAWIRDEAFSTKGVGGLVEFDLDAEVRGTNLAQQDVPIVTRYPAPAGTVTGYVADFDGEPGLAYTYDQGHAVHFWEPREETWRRLPLDPKTATPLALDPDRSRLWVSVHDAQAGYQLRPLDLATSRLGDPVYSDTDYDLGEAALRFSRTTRKLSGLVYEGARKKSVWLDPKFAALQEKLAGSLPPDADHTLLDSDSVENRFVVRSAGPSRPPAYFIFDRAANKLIDIAGSAPSLEKHALRPARPVSFPARDGLQLFGYLTLPEDASRERPAPLVVLLHGGPWVRDSWAYDPDAQFLASRGYAVLQPNYRGSSGYAPAISLDPRFDFLRMRDDVIDATRKLVASGLVDPGRIAVMGGSFGGYLALAAANSEPELYRAAVSVCGVFDWADHVGDLKERRGKFAYDFYLSNLGDPAKNQARFEEISVFRQLDRLQAPVFLAHGLKDSVVSVTQTRRLASELKKRDHPVETFYRVLGGHGFAHQKDRVAYYQKLEAFLARHLAPAPAAAPAIAAAP